MFLQLDGTFVLQIVNFAIFYLILRAVFILPVGKGLRARREYLNRVAADYNDAVERAKELRAQAERKRALARQEAAETLALARAEANAEADQIAAAYAERATSLIDQAQTTVATEYAAAAARAESLAREVGASLLDRAVASAGRT